MRIEDRPEIVTVVKQEQDTGGHASLCDLIMEWTKLFEQQHANTEWGVELDWFDTIEAFFAAKNKEIIE